MTEKLYVHDKATCGSNLCQYGCTSVIACSQINISCYNSAKYCCCKNVWGAEKYIQMW